MDNVYWNLLNPVFDYSEVNFDNLFGSLFKNYIDNINLYFGEFWEKKNDEILEIFNNFSNLYDKDAGVLFFNLLKKKINENFEKSFLITPNFRYLLENNYYFYEYFEWLKKFQFSFFEKEEIYHYHGECSYEPDIEEPDVYFVKIRIFLPFTDYDEILDFMEVFLLEHEKYLKLHFSNYINKEKIFEQFHNSYFIFRSMNE